LRLVSLLESLDIGKGDRRRFGARLAPVVAPLFLNALPFSRRRSIRKSMNLMGEALDEGWSVVLYPGEARSTSGQLLPFKAGVGMIASEMRVPIVPVKLSGSFDILPKGKLFPFKESVKVVFGKPLFFQGRHDHERIARQV